MRKCARLIVLVPALMLGTLLQAQEDCASAGGVDFICGPTNAEDLVLMPGTDWIISSGMAQGAGFYQVDAASGDWRPLGLQIRHDAATYPECSTPPTQARTASSSPPSTAPSVHTN